MVKTYDPKCGELAVHFLADDDMSHLTSLQVIRRTDSLALAIQQAVEDWKEDEATEHRHPQRVITTDTVTGVQLERLVQRDGL
jgi:hypothetical protein